MKLLNKDKIAELAQEIGNENVPMLLNIFLSELDNYRQTLEHCSESEQMDQLKEISHALKSSAASFGADLLCDIAVDIDGKGKRDELTNVTVETERLVRTVKETYAVYSDSGNF